MFRVSRPMLVVVLKAWVTPARKATLHRGFRQDRGDERDGQRHPDRVLALARADGERVDGLGGIDQEFVEPAVSVAQCFDETVSRFRPHGSLGSFHGSIPNPLMDPR